MAPCGCCAAAGERMVEQVVLTSAANTCVADVVPDPGRHRRVVVTDPDAPRLDPYRRSKTLAEQAAWAFPGSALLTEPILPGAVFG